MSETSPTQTLSPAMNGQDSSNPPTDGPDSSNLQDPATEPASQPAEPDAPANTSDKRKREPDPELVIISNPEPGTGSEPELAAGSDPNPGTDRENNVNPWWKTSLCSYFRRTDGSCSHGETCRYAHGEAELRPRPDNTWDPTSERVKKVPRIEEKVEKEKEMGEVIMTEAVDEVAEGEGDGDDLWGLSKCLVNLPMKWSSDKLRSFLDEQGISYKSAKKKKGMVVGFLTFNSAAEVKVAVKDLEGKTVGNNRTLKISDTIQRSFDKRKNSMHSFQTELKTESQSLAADSLNSNEGDEPIDNSSALFDSHSKRSVRDAVTPLAHMSYTDQLEHKKSSLIQTLKRLTKNARKACPNGISLPEWILKAREIGGLPCKFEGIIESPIVNGYRNKCEFSVGFSVQGKPTVGFQLGNFREGVTAVEEPVDCPNVSKIAGKYAVIFQEFLQDSGLPIWNRLNNTGFWRQLTVREGRAASKTTEVDNTEANFVELMLIVQVSTVGFDNSKVEGEFERMAQAFSAGAARESPSLPLTALLIQDHTGISNAAPSDAPLRSLSLHKDSNSSLLETANDAAEVRMHDYIGKLQFSISPTAFFQVNTLAAEKLYSLAGDWADLGPDTLLFDICCGTGTIGLTLAHRVGMVVGIEMNASAVSDAQKNAELNNIKNCRFVCGKAEHVVGSLMKEYLSLPEKQDEASGTQKENDDKTHSTEEKIDSAGSELGAENGPCSELESSSDANGSLKDESNPPKKNDTTDSKTASTLQFKNVVAIVDPPRFGLHPTVIKVLRTQSRLRRLVYISCNPDSLVANAIELCTPSPETFEKGNNKNNRGWRSMSSAGLARHRAKSMPSSEPFKPVKAMAVDLFPHTTHCELVMLLER